MTDSTTTIDQQTGLVEERLRAAAVGDTELTVIKAPPGSGKTYMLLRAVDAASEEGLRVAVGAQTNSQVDDICRRIAEDYPHIPVVRFSASGGASRELGHSVSWISDKKKLPTGPCVVVATIAKWSLVKLEELVFDIMLVDEAWQMSWADFMLCGQVAPRFVLIGDPGQIPPIVPIPAHRWETSPRAPHQAAPELILADPTLPAVVLELPACRRLPHDSVDLIRPFYDFPFAAYAQPGERSFILGPSNGNLHPGDGALDLLTQGSVAALALPTPPEGPPLELDAEVAAIASQIAVRALERSTTVVNEAGGGEEPLEPEDIGLAATHRIVNNAMHQALPPELRGRVGVDTPERWQGLERKLMIVVHPLSGVTAPSAFDLETGRLCVMTSRHRAGLIVVARDHIRETLETHIPSAEQAVGRPDTAGRGHETNLRFWESMEDAGRVARAT